MHGSSMGSGPLEWLIFNINSLTGMDSQSSPILNLDNFYKNFFNSCSCFYSSPTSIQAMRILIHET